MRTPLLLTPRDRYPLGVVQEGGGEGLAPPFLQGLDTPWRDMPWDTSTRRSRLPSNWQSIRLRVLRRDAYRCQNRDDAAAPKCLEPASDVDHIVRGDDHDLSNLQALCKRHHVAKTTREATEARAAMPKRTRPAERHPGLA